MIKFFRKTRKKMADDNKPIKYLRYAIGEIVLVVVGILIALSINNWNENVKTHRNQQNNLQLIKVEMINNLKAVFEEKKELDKTIVSCRDLINLINTPNNLKNIEERELSFLIAGLIRDDVQAFLENGAMNQLIASDGLKNIENDNIRTILASWHSKTSYVRLQEQHIFNSQSKIREYINTNGNVKVLFEEIGYSQKLELKNSQIKQSNKHLLKDQELENNILILIVNGKTLQEKVYPEFENEIRAVIDLIDQELKKN
jgi:hypothetical protein